VEYRILGSVCVSDGDRHTPVRAAKQRALLAILLLNANEPVAADGLIDQLWDGRPPATARKVLQIYVHQRCWLHQPPGRTCTPSCSNCTSSMATMLALASRSGSAWNSDTQHL
jgi:DNA-binding SARP family transcriptional activator